jgi:hypothetical protein
VLTGNRLLGRYGGKEGGEYLIANVLFDYTRDYAKTVGRELRFTPQTFPAAVVGTGLAQRRNDRNAPFIRIGAERYYALYISTPQNRDDREDKPEKGQQNQIVSLSSLPDLEGVLKIIETTGICEQNQSVDEPVASVVSVLKVNTYKHQDLHPQPRTGGRPNSQQTRQAQGPANPCGTTTNTPSPLRAHATSAETHQQDGNDNGAASDAASSLSSPISVYSSALRPQSRTGGHPNLQQLRQTQGPTNTCSTTTNTPSPLRAHATLVEPHQQEGPGTKAASPDPDPLPPVGPGRKDRKAPARAEKPMGKGRAPGALVPPHAPESHCTASLSASTAAQPGHEHRPERGGAIERETPEAPLASPNAHSGQKPLSTGTEVEATGDHGEGGNNALLHLLGREARHCDDFEQLLDRARTLNEEFANPMPDEEVATISRSIWDYTNKDFSEGAKVEALNPDPPPRKASARAERREPAGAPVTPQAASPGASAAAQPRSRERRPERIAVLGLDQLWIREPDGAIERSRFDLSPEKACHGLLVALAVREGFTQVWLSEPYATAAGLPHDLNDQAVREGIKHRFASFKGAPSDWKSDRPGCIKPWLNVRTEENEIAIAIPSLAPDTAFGDAKYAETLLRAIGKFRAATKYNFIANPAVVFFNMIRMMHKGPGTLDLTASLAPKDFPAVFKTDGAITRDIWARPLTEEERSCGFVHVFDKNGMYLAAISSLALGFEKPEHVKHPIPFNKDMVGYFKVRITPPASWSALLPHPCFIRPADGTHQWQVAPALNFAHETGCEIDIVEAYLFPKTHRPLEPVYTRLREARAACMEDADEASRIALTAIKQIYTHGIGNLANTTHQNSEKMLNLYRPDWRHCIRSQARANLLRNIDKAGLRPFGIRTDAIYIISPSPDPMVAAGSLRIGKTLRDWKHVKTFPLELLPREFFDDKAAASPQHYLDAIKKIRI